MVRNILHLVVGLLIGSVVGFAVANFLADVPRTQPNEQQVAKSNRGESVTSDKGDAPLSNEEIRQAIARADQEPGNLKLQKDLGTGLLRYAAFTGDSSYLDDIVRLLTRVQKSSPQDSDVLTALGDIELIKAQAGDKTKLKSAEAYYQRSLELKGENVTVHSNLGLVYMNMDPPSYSRARGEFERALKMDPTNERALQGAALASIRSGDGDRARRFMEVLRSSHPNSDSIRQLETELEKSANGTNRNKL